MLEVTTKNGRYFGGKRLSMAAAAVLAALAIDLVGTRWGSYLPSPVPGVFLADALLLMGAGLALALRSHGRNVQALLLVLPVSSYCLARALDYALTKPAPWSLFLRDQSPFLYLCLFPLLVRALVGVEFAMFIRLIRWCSIGMAAIVLLGLFGMLRPIGIGTQVPAFLMRPDVDNVVLGLGILAFGGWAPHTRSRPAIQVILLVIASAHYSRAGLLAAGFCFACALIRERKAWVKLERVAWLLVIAVGVVAVGFVGFTVAAALTSHTPDAIARLFGAGQSGGTTSARVMAWKVMLNYTTSHGNLVMGSGPGSQPMLQSGAYLYLSGQEDVRAPHNWLIGMLAYHGLVGTLTWAATWCAILVTIRRTASAPIVIPGILAYLLCGLMGVVIESPFGSLPMVALAAFAVASQDRVATTGSSDRTIRRMSARRQSLSSRGS